MTSVNTYTTQRLGNPNRVACEDLVVFRCTGELDQTQLHDEVVYEFLDLLLCKLTGLQVTLCVAVDEGRSTAQRHSCTVLLLNCAQITEVCELDRFLYVGSRLGNVDAVRSSHFLHHLQGYHLLGKLFTKTDHIICHHASGGILLSLLVLDQSVDTVQCNTTVVTDDTATAVSIRKTCDYVRGTACTHLRCVSIEAACIVCLSVYGEELADLRIYGITIVCASLLSHTDTAVYLHGTLERLVGLETYDGLLALIQVARAMRGDGRYYLGIHIQYTACLTLLT